MVSAVAVVCMSLCLVLGALFGSAGHFSGGSVPRGLLVPICGGLRTERAGVSPPPGGAYRIFSLDYSQGTFSLCILYIYLIFMLIL